jgi:hypothetical protein
MLPPLQSSQKQNMILVNMCIQTQKTFVLAKTLESAKAVAVPPSVVLFVYEGYLKPVFDCYGNNDVITLS